MKTVKHPTLDILCREDGAVYTKDAGNSKSYSWKFGRLLKSGYREICKGKKHYLVHRLIAEAFLDNPGDKPTVDHINRNRSDNRVENLRWATHKEQNENCSTVDNRMRFSVRACEDVSRYNCEYGKHYRAKNVLAIKAKKKLWYSELKKKFDVLGLIHHKCPDGVRRWHLPNICPVCWSGSDLSIRPISVGYRSSKNEPVGTVIQR